MQKNQRNRLKRGEMRTFNPLLAITLWVTALFVSWSLYQNRPELLSWQFHAGLQAGLQEFVTDHIQKRLPDATDIQFTSLWSRSIDDDRVKVFFEYQFQLLSDQAQSQLKGSALLSSSSQDPQRSWTIKEVHIDEQSIEYTPEIVMTPLAVDFKRSASPKADLGTSSTSTTSDPIGTSTVTSRPIQTQVLQSISTIMPQVSSTTTSSSSLSTLQNQSVLLEPASAIPVLPPLHLND